MSKFKVGDRVMHDSTLSGIRYFGVVKEIDQVFPGNYEVEFDGEPWPWFIGECLLQPSIIHPGMFELVKIPSACNHTWKQYAGLVESFEYCIHCDEKKRSSCE